MIDAAGLSTDAFKASAGVSAAAHLHDGMIVGLGSGTTAALAVAAIGRRVEAGLKIVGIPTSEKTADQARLLKIPLSTLEDHPVIDVTIDGADEVEERSLNLIKGGGGNLLREKIVAIASSQMIIVVDERKLVDRLGSRTAVPVEVIPFGWKTTAERLKCLGAQPVLRLRSDGKPFVTDGGHWIFDCIFESIQAPRLLQAMLDSTVGVVEHGLFIGIASMVLVGGPGGVSRLNRDPAE